MCKLQNRGASHRIAEYKVWQRLGYHVLTIDYRGYGDTVMNGTIGERTLVEDSKAAIKLIRHAQSGPYILSRIFGKWV